MINVLLEWSRENEGVRGNGRMCMYVQVYVCVRVSVYASDAVIREKRFNDSMQKRGEWNE